MKKLLAAVAIAGCFVVPPAVAAPFFFSSGAPDGKLATASRPASLGKIQIESADDFILTSHTLINKATFIGLLPAGTPLGNVNALTIDIYRIFPKDSDLGRTSGAPPFSTANVPSRVNSPADVEIVGRDSIVPGELTFTTTILNANFTAANIVLNGINPKPNQTTGGEGAVSGQEVQFDVTLVSPFDLPADHYFFVPKVGLASGDFFWLSAAKPIVSGTPITPDLQSWIRSEVIDPDWLRIGTDIIGGSPAPTFNASFSLNGTALPEPGTLALLALALVTLNVLRKGARNVQA